MKRRRGRPVVGAIAGLFLGLMVSVDLILLGMLPTNAPALLVFPPAGLVLGILMGRLAPLARLRKSPADSPDEAAAAPIAEQTP